MTEFHVEAVVLKDVRKHPNAQTLSIATVHNGYPVIFKTGEHQEGDLVAYVPVDSVVPATEQWAWLGDRDKDRRIKAKRLRGIFSMGLIAPLPPEATARFWREGDDLAAAMGITKYEPEVETPQELVKPWRTIKRNAPWWKVLFWSIVLFFRLGRFFGPKPVLPPKLPHLPGDYDIEPFRKYGKKWFEDGEVVVVTEKIHGRNASFVHDGKKLHVKSRTQWRRNDPTEPKNTWAKVAKRHELEDKLSKFPGIMLFGETYGNNADMPYGVDPNVEGDRFAAFDAFDTNTGEWLSWFEFWAVCTTLDVPTVPVLDSFCWADGAHDYLLTLAEGKTKLPGGHVREGFVVKPSHERRTDGGRRVILKMAGEGYLTRKAA